MIGAITGRVIVQLVVRSVVTEFARNAARDGYNAAKRVVTR